METLIVKKSFSFLASLFLLLLFTFLQFYTSEAVNGTIPAVIAFGDSILDTGNNNGLSTLSKCNYIPYGTDFPAKIPTGRFGNGKVFSDLIAEGLGVKSILPAYLDPNLKDSDLATGVCFASGGSGLDDGTANIQSVLTITQQLNNFKEYKSRLTKVVGEAKAKEIISKALFLISSGNNDIAISFYGLQLKQGLDINTYTSQLVASASAFVKNLYELGARKIAFMGTLPLGCLPAARALTGPFGACVEFVNQGGQMFNTKLSNEIKSLNSALGGAKIFYVDFYNPLNKIIRNPQSSGFEDASMGCCGTGVIKSGLTLCTMFYPSCSDPSTHVFWDPAHPSEKAYRIVVSEILKNDAVNFA